MEFPGRPDGRRRRKDRSRANCGVSRGRCGHYFGGNVRNAHERTKIASDGMS